MSDQSENSGSKPPDERNVAQQLRLRPERPRVTRLSRKVLVGPRRGGSRRGAGGDDLGVAA